jgi:hypothetical protein
MKYFNSAKFNFVVGVLFVTALTLRAQSDDFGFAIEGHISGYDIQGAPDLGIAAGDHFTGTFHFLDGHYGVTPDGSIRYDHYSYGFLANIEINGNIFSTAGGAGITGGDLLLGGGPVVIVSPNVDYSLYFPTMYLNIGKLGFFDPYVFTIYGSGGPSSLSPNGSSLHIDGGVDSTAAFDFTAPDPVRTDALLVLAVATLLVSHRMLKKRLAL